MAASGSFDGLTLDQLNSLLAVYLQCITAIAVRGTSYSIAGRSFSFPNIPEVNQTILELNYAIGKLTGARSGSARANFNPSLGRGAPGNIGFGYGN